MAIKFCFLCYKGINSLGNHLRWEHPTVSIQNYYDKFFKKENEGFCQNENCNNETLFNIGKFHYNTYCCNRCMKTSTTYKQRCATGVTKVWKLRTNEERKEIGQKILSKKPIKIKKENPIKTTIGNNREKAKQTTYNKTGYYYWMQTPEAREKFSNRYKNLTEEEMNLFKKAVSDGLNNMDKDKKIKSIQTRVNTMKNKSDIEKEQIRIKKQNAWKQKTKEELHLIQQKIAHNTTHKYIYKNVDFHSFDEMAFYIYNVECLNNNIIRNNFDFYLKFYYNDEEFSYYPDFKINEQYVEIKGLQFFENKNPTGKMINPYDRTEDDKYEAKHQCMVNNNVIIITDTNKYKQYVINKYGNVQRIE